MLECGACSLCGNCTIATPTLALLLPPSGCMRRFQHGRSICRQTAVWKHILFNIRNKTSWNIIYSSVTTMHRCRCRSGCRLVLSGLLPCCVRRTARTRKGARHVFIDPRSQQLQQLPFLSFLLPLFRFFNARCKLAGDAIRCTRQDV